MWTLTRERDGAGDRGKLLVLLQIDEDNQLQYYHPKDIHDLKVGWAVRVGAARATMFGADTYWTTTYITEILDSDETSIRFKTGNSIYTLKE